MQHINCFSSNFINKPLTHIRCKFIITIKKQCIITRRSCYTRVTSQV